MNNERQFQELCRLYGEQSDEQLLALYEGREDLTDVAQQALTRVMGERRLEAPEDAGEAEPADVALMGDEAKLYTFFDGIEASTAAAALEEEGIWLRVSNPGPAMTSDAQSPGAGLTVIVKQRNFEGAVELLRRKMGLFPGPEGEEDEGIALHAVGGMVLLSMFDRSEGLVAAEALGRAGISYCWRDGSEEVGELPDEMTVAIEVRADRLERANAAVEAGLLALPEDEG